jgi:hypothetical protein
VAEVAVFDQDGAYVKIEIYRFRQGGRPAIRTLLVNDSRKEQHNGR